MADYETQAGLPTLGLCFARIHERLIQIQEDCAMAAHLTRAQGGRKDNALADGWVAVSEMMKRVDYQVTQLAKARLQ